MKVVQFILVKPSQCSSCGRSLPLGSEVWGEWQDSGDMQTICDACKSKQSNQGVAK